MKDCPACNQKNTTGILYSSENIPVLNNVTYDSEKEAKSCLTGNIGLTQCRECGLVFNVEYNKELVNYDRKYDGSRDNSSVYKSYLVDVVSLCEGNIDGNLPVIEIGCGSGDFLKKLSDVTGCIADGYDISYSGEPVYKDRVFFYNSYFTPHLGNKKYGMLILRHVLEHIFEPLNFLKQLIHTKVFKKGMKIVIEVPSLEWIIDSRAYYDITYEHCNYFTENALLNLASLVGIECNEIIRTFSGQYTVFIGTYLGSRQINTGFFSPHLNTIDFHDFICFKSSVTEFIKKKERICLWGASGKGVIFLSLLPDDLLKNIAYVIDINKSKQGKYLPLSALRISPPAILQKHSGNLAILVMNPFYASEINEMLDKMKVNATIILPVNENKSDFQ